MKKLDLSFPAKMVGKAWVGVWNERKRRLGWAMPNFVDHYHTNGPLQETWAQGEFWKCKVTIELFKDKKGRTYRKVVGGARW
jgi:hypothetical protein